MQIPTLVMFLMTVLNPPDFATASLRFIPVKNLKEEGYGDYLMLFNKNTMMDNIQNQRLSENMRGNKEGM